MLNSGVLVLNRSFLPVHVTSVRRAFSLIFQDIARAVNENYETFDFEAWMRLPTDDAAAHETIGTPRGPIRVPRVIALPGFDRVPRRSVRYSRMNVLARDKFTCQYCGERPHRSLLNLDHVVPRALGGKTTWENVVCSCVECNRQKGGRTPEQAKLRLSRRPERPHWMPLFSLGRQAGQQEAWRPFLGVVDAGMRRQSPASD
jgi:5-methylcytosine-specific restriction endonuclease McrA